MMYCWYVTVLLVIATTSVHASLIGGQSSDDIEVSLHCVNGLTINPQTISVHSWWQVVLSLENEGDESFVCDRPNERIVGLMQEVIESNTEGIEHSVVVVDGKQGPFTVKFSVATEGIRNIFLTETGLSFKFSSGLGMFTYTKLEVYDANNKRLSSQMRLEDQTLYLDVLEAGEYPIIIDPLLAVEFPEGNAYFEPQNTLQMSEPNNLDDNTLNKQNNYASLLNNGGMFGWKVGTAALSRQRTEGLHDIVVGEPQYRGIPNTDDDIVAGDSNSAYEPIIHNVGRLHVYKNSGTILSTTFPNGLSVKTPTFESPTNEAPSTSDDCNSPRFGLDFAVGARTGGSKLPESGFDEVWSGSFYCRRSILLTGKSGGYDSRQSDHEYRQWTYAIGKELLFHGEYSRRGDVENNGQVCYGQQAKEHKKSHCKQATEVENLDFGEQSYKFGGAMVSHPLLEDRVVTSDFQFYNRKFGAVFLVNPRNENDDFEVDWIALGEQFDSHYGKALALADVNNDGIIDLLVGDPAWSGTTIESGRVHVYLGVGSSFSTKADQVIEGVAVNGQFGTTIANLHDINQDGIDDIAISAPYADNGKGRVYIYLGGDKLTYHQTIRGIQEGELFGFSISEGKDLNDDGIPDSVIGAPGFKFNDVELGGRAAVLFGLEFCRISITAAPSSSPALSNTPLSVAFTFTNNGPESTPTNVIVEFNVPNSDIYGTTTDDTSCTKLSATQFQCILKNSLSSSGNDASTTIQFTLPFDLGSPVDTTLSFRATVKKLESILSDVTFDVQVPLINEVNLQLVASTGASSNTRKAYAAINNDDVTDGTLPNCVTDGVSCPVTVQDVVLFRGPHIVNSGDMSAHGVVLIISHPPDLYYVGDEDCVIGCPTPNAAKEFSCTSSGVGTTRCTIVAEVGAKQTIEPFEGRLLKFNIPVATGSGDFTFEMQLTTTSVATTPSLSGTTNILARAELESNIGVISNSLSTQTGCSGNGVYAGNSFDITITVKNKAQYSSANTVVTFVQSSDSPFSLVQVPSLTLVNGQGSKSTFCLLAGDGRYDCSVPSGFATNTDDIFLLLSGTVRASALSTDKLGFTVSVSTSTPQSLETFPAKSLLIEYPVCVSSAMDVMLIPVMSASQGLPDSSSIYPYENLALVRTLTVVNSGPSDKLGAHSTTVTITGAHEAWGIIPSGCTQDSATQVTCVGSDMLVNEFRQWRIATVLQHKNVIEAVVPSVVAVSKSQDGTETTAAFSVYHGVDIGLSSNEFAQIALGGDATFTLTTTNLHPSTPATNLVIDWVFPDNLIVYSKDITYSGFDVQPVCTIAERAIENSENKESVLTCVTNNPPASSTRVRVPVLASIDIAPATGVLVTASIVSLDQEDTQSYAPPLFVRAKNAQWSFATTAFADVEAKLVPNYGQDVTSNGAYEFALDQTVELQASLREKGVLVTADVVATLTWDENMILRAGSVPKCLGVDAMYNATSWTCIYGQIDQEAKFEDTTFTFDYIATPEVGSTYVALWEITSSNDNKQTNDAAAVTLQITEAKVKMSMTSAITPKTVLPNQAYTVTINCQNIGPSPAKNVTLYTSSWVPQWLNITQMPEVEGVTCTLDGSQVHCDLPELRRGVNSVQLQFMGISSPAVQDELNDFQTRTIWELAENTIVSHEGFEARDNNILTINFQPKATVVPDNTKARNLSIYVSVAAAIYLAANGIFMLYHGHFFARNPPPEAFVEPDVGEL
eukprot:CFRG3564T1